MIENMDKLAEKEPWILDWRECLSDIPKSRRQLTWVAGDTERDLWKRLILIRHTGLRIYNGEVSTCLTTIPTDMPILGWKDRRLTIKEGMRLQGFNDDLVMPDKPETKQKAVGNAINVNVASRLAEYVFN